MVESTVAMTELQMPKPRKPQTATTSPSHPSRHLQGQQEELTKRGQAFERRSLDQYEAAIRSETGPEFLRKIKQALIYQRRASALFGRLGAGRKAHHLRSQTMEAFLYYWLSKKYSEKNRLLEQSWDLAERSLRSFQASNNFPEYAEAFLRFSPCVGLSVENDGSPRSRIRKLRKAVETGRKTIRIIKSTGNKEETAKIQTRVSGFLEALAEDSPDKTKQAEYMRESLYLYEESLRLSREACLREIAHPLPGFHKIQDFSINRNLCEEALAFARTRGDHFAIGRLLDHLAKWTCYMAESSESGENPAQVLSLRSESLHFAEEAARHYDIINFTSPIGGTMWVHSPYAQHFQGLARIENDRTKRQLLLEKALRFTSGLLRLAKSRGSPLVKHYAVYATYMSERQLAEAETDRPRKKQLLRKALSHSTLARDLINEMAPLWSFNRALILREVVTARSKLAEVEEDPRVQTRLIQESIQDLEECVRKTNSHLRTLEPSERRAFADLVGLLHRTYGETLLRAVSVAKNEEYLRKASKEFSLAVESYRNIPRYDRIAECYWRMAEAYDLLQAHSLASESFAQASKTYSRLGRRVDALKQHCQDYSRYLMAWARIEEARASHGRGQYGPAAESYNSAARLLKSSNRWGLHAPYFSAWSKLEEGEELSRQGLREPAIDSFQKAAILFSQAREHAKERIPMLTPDIRSMAESLVAAPGTEYVQARIAIEEAVEAESLGDYPASFEKFGFASEKLREVSDRSESDEERGETEFLSTLCEAWQLSSKAEADNTSGLLEKALALFERANDLSQNHTSTNLALGHVAFCKGLIAEHNFAETFDQTFLTEASRQLDSSAGYYLESGFLTASEHAMGRKLLVDALAQMHEATSEQEQQNKALRLKMAAALLEESAETLRKARQPRKREQVLALLEKARTDSKVASNLSEILQTTLRATTNIAFSTLAKGDEKAVGLDRFARGDVDIRLAKVETNSTGDLEVEVEITNTGTQPVRLIRLEEIVPDGTELKESPGGWKIEGRSMSAMAKRIRNLQTETVRITIRPGGEGLLRIGPKVVFVDNSGVQSERTMEPKIIATSPIVDFLAKAFVEDFASKRLTLQVSGWRTLMEIVRDLRIPRSYVYGDPRYGRPFGRQLESLLKSSLIEHRIFAGQRGRGGDVTKLRVLLSNENVRAYIDNLVPTGKGAIDWMTQLQQTSIVA